MHYSSTVLAAVALIDRAKEQVTRTEAAASRLLAERRRLAAVPIGQDDLIAHLKSELDAAVGDFTTLLTTRLASAASTRATSAGLWGIPHATVALYFLRDQIADQIPALVEQHGPDAETGLTNADRRGAVSRVEDEFAKLVEGVGTLLQQLAEEKERLRIARQTAIHANDRSERSSLEIQQMDLETVAETVRQTQAFVVQAQAAR